ncbi:MAG: pyridoxal 5'-phosphate synthase glutaminase subunit PdxT [Huintestinicola sp.]
MGKPVVGVLALQGAFIEHEKKIEQIGGEAFEIRQLPDIDRSFDGLIIPGGESTVQRKLLHELGLYEPLRALIRNGLPVFGTCAGMILLAEKIDGGEESCFGTMPFTVKRNAYGRQLGSFFTESDFAGKTIPMTFIRAPYVSDAGSTDIISEVNGRIVAVRYHNQLAAAFHPELNEDTFVHEYFLDMIERK